MVLRLCFSQTNPLVLGLCIGSNSTSPSSAVCPVQFRIVHVQHNDIRVYDNKRKSPREKAHRDSRVLPYHVSLVEKNENGYVKVRNPFFPTMWNWSIYSPDFFMSELCMHFYQFSTPPFNEESSYHTALYNSGRHHLELLLLRMGRENARYMKLKEPTLSMELFESSPDHLKIYFLTQEGTRRYREPDDFVLGYLKIAVIKLDYYIRGNHIYKDTNVIVDFFILEDYQRQGRGYEIFEIMLAESSIRATQVGARPLTPIIASFLKKWYHFEEHVILGNGVAVFPEWWFEFKNQKTS